MITYRVKYKLNGEWKTIELPWPGEDIYACLAAAKSHLRKLYDWTAGIAICGPQGESCVYAF